MSTNDKSHTKTPSSSSCRGASPGSYRPASGGYDKVRRPMNIRIYAEILFIVNHRSCAEVHTFLWTHVLSTVEILVSIFLSRPEPQVGTSLVCRSVLLGEPCSCCVCSDLHTSVARLVQISLPILNSKFCWKSGPIWQHC